MSPTRRSLLGGAAALAAAPVALAVQVPDHPDADLVRLCADHAANMHAYNRDGGLGEIDDPDPLWDAYARTRDAITDARPRTLVGLQAKARAAKAEAMSSRLDGTEMPEGTPAEGWAWDLVNDLLAIGSVA